MPYASFRWLILFMLSRSIDESWLLSKASDKWSILNTWRKLYCAITTYRTYHEWWMSFCLATSQWNFLPVSSQSPRSVKEILDPGGRDLRSFSVDFRVPINLSAVLWMVTIYYPYQQICAIKIGQTYCKSMKMMWKSIVWMQGSTHKAIAIKKTFLLRYIFFNLLYKYYMQCNKILLTSKDLRCFSYFFNSSGYLTLCRQLE